MFKEVIFFVIFFLFMYLIIYLDHKINKKCKCYDEISIKIPFVITVLSYIAYKCLEVQVNDYINGFSTMKQDIITDMADF
jgi:hypothetical protein